MARRGRDMRFSEKWYIPIYGILRKKPSKILKYHVRRSEFGLGKAHGSRLSMSLAARSISPVSQAAVLALRRNVRSNSSLQAVPSLARLDLRISGMETTMPSDGMNAVRKRRPESDSRTPCGAVSAESKARRRRVEMGQRALEHSAGCAQRRSGRHGQQPRLPLET